MALKFLLVFGILFAAIVVEISEAQFERNPNGIDYNLLGISVTLYCTPDGNMGILGPATPAFGGANVQFQCGNNSEIIARATTNIFGSSYIVTSSVPVLPFYPLESNCKLVVNTPLSTCDPALPLAGRLESGLRFVGSFVLGSLNVTNYAPTGFRYSPTM